MLKKQIATLLFAASFLSAAVPFGREVKQDQVSITVSAVSASPFAGAPSNVPTGPGGKDGVMLAVASETAETSAFNITVKVKLADGSQTTSTQTIKRARGWSKYTPALFMIGRVSEVLSVTVEELKAASAAEFVE